MTTFYKLAWDPGAVSARAARELESGALPPTRRNGSIGASWKRIPLDVHDGDALPDYLPNNLQLRLCSSKMRAVIDWASGEVDAIEWLRVDVRWRASIHTYYILHLPFPKTEEARRLVAEANAPSSRVSANRILGAPRAPGERDAALFIAEDVYAALVGASCTGCAYSAL